MADATLLTSAALPVRWAKVIDHTRCIGCHACSTACKSENQVPLGVQRTYVKYVETGTFPQTRRAFQVTRCNQCEDPPCATACPTAAMHQRRDGIVDFDKSVCIGCKACIAACPYDAIFINPEDGTAEKCNFCAQRIDVGLEPACVVVCPTEAILVGDLNDSASRVAGYVGREPVTVRRPEKDTRPMLFYKGAHQATLDPLAARTPHGGIFLWSEQGAVPHQVTSGHPDGDADGGPGNAAAALLAYDVPHRAPWDWRVSLYTWTKGIAAGSYLVAALLVAFGMLSVASPLWTWAAPILAGVFLAATGVLLLADLRHPERFYMIFTRRQWRSWLVRGGVLITAYGVALFGHVLAGVTGAAGVQGRLMVAGVPVAILAAVYTAWLFAQARARDLWQSPLLPPMLLVQATMAGGAALALFAPWVEPTAAPLLAGIAAAATFAHLLMTAGEVTLTHPTAHARLAVRNMTMGRQGRFFWSGITLQAAGVVSLAPVPVLVAPLVLAGLLAYEHAYVQAGQSVPLA